MTLAAGEFMRRFLMHVLPDGFHRIRHYGLLANGHRADNYANAQRRIARRRYAVFFPQVSAPALHCYVADSMLLADLLRTSS
jgi:hypothetical protein